MCEFTMTIAPVRTAPFFESAPSPAPRLAAPAGRCRRSIGVMVSLAGLRFARGRNPKDSPLPDAAYGPSHDQAAQAQTHLPTSPPTSAHRAAAEALLPSNSCHHRPSRRLL